jgi:hypothetical protein
MNLTQIRLPSTKGATLLVTAKTYGNIARAAEDHAAILRAEAKAGNQIPSAVMAFWKGASTDIEAVKVATLAEIEAIDSAINVLEGHPAPRDMHPLIMMAKELEFTCAAFSHASNQLVRDKAAGLRDEAKAQLKATKEAAHRAIADHDHRLEAMKHKCADALRVSIAGHNGELRINMKDAADLMNISGLPRDGGLLPAPDASAPAGSPGRHADLLQQVCRSKQLEAELLDEHRAAQKARKTKPRTKLDIVADELRELGER